MRNFLRALATLAMLLIMFGCSNRGESLTGPKEEVPRQYGVAEIALADTAPPSWLALSDIYVGHDSLNTTDLYGSHLGLEWLNPFYAEFKTSFLVANDQDIFVAARHYYGYDIYPWSKAGANLIIGSDWNVVNPTDSTNGFRVAEKTKFYSKFWRTEEFDVFNRPIWGVNDTLLLRKTEVKNGSAVSIDFGRRQAVYFLESSYEVKTLRCVQDGTTKIRSSFGVIFRRTDFMEPQGVLSPPVNVPNINLKCTMFESQTQALYYLQTLRGVE